MFRTRLAAKRQEKAQAAFARKWMVAEPKRKPDPMYGRKWNHHYTVHRRPGLMARLRSSWAVRIAAGSTAALSASSGMAFAGVLPEPLQRAASDLADKVGIDIPSPDDSRTSGAVHEVIERKDDFEKGKDFGHAVREAAHEANAARREAKAAEKAGDDESHGESKDLKDKSKNVPAGVAKGHESGGSKPNPVDDEDGANADNGPAPESQGKSEEDHGKADPPAAEPEKPATPEKPGAPPAAPGKPDDAGQPAKPEKPEKP
jgi:hypothetical protein